MPNEHSHKNGKSFLSYDYGMRDMVQTHIKKIGLFYYHSRVDWKSGYFSMVFLLLPDLT